MGVKTWIKKTVLFGVLMWQTLTFVQYSLSEEPPLSYVYVAMATITFALIPLFGAEKVNKALARALAYMFYILGVGVFAYSLIYRIDTVPLISIAVTATILLSLGGRKRRELRPGTSWL